MCPEPSAIRLSARRASGGTGGERALHLFHAVRLDPVADLEVIEILDADAALEPLAHFADLGLAEDGLPLLRLEQPLEGVAYVLHRLVDDAVGADVHLLPLRGGTGVGIGPDVEAQ